MKNLKKRIAVLLVAGLIAQGTHPIAAAPLAQIGQKKNIAGIENREKGRDPVIDMATDSDAEPEGKPFKPLDRENDGFDSENQERQKEHTGEIKKATDSDAEPGKKPETKPSDQENNKPEVDKSESGSNDAVKDESGSDDTVKDKPGSDDTVKDEPGSDDAAKDEPDPDTAVNGGPETDASPEDGSEAAIPENGENESEAETEEIVIEEEQPISQTLALEAAQNTDLGFAFIEDSIRGCVGQWIYCSTLLDISESDIQGEFSCTSSDPEIVEIRGSAFSDTALNLKKEGKAFIKAVLTLETDEEVEADITVEVVERQLKFTTNENPIRFRLGEETEIPLDPSYLGYDIFGNGMWLSILDYEIKDEQIASVAHRSNKLGKVTGRKLGKTTLKVKAADYGLEESRDIEVYTDIQLGDLKVERNFPGATEISWTMENTSYYQIERAVGMNQFKVIFNGEDGKGENHFVDKGLEAGGWYRYRISALTENVNQNQRFTADTKEIMVTVSDKQIGFEESYIYVNETYQLKLVYTGYEGEEYPAALWSVEDSEIARIDDSGKVTGVKEGVTQITVRLDDGNEWTGYIRVNAREEVEDLMIAVNYHQYVKLTWSKVDYIESYVVYRRENDGEWEKLGEDTKPEIIDKTAVSGHIYQYKVALRDRNYRNDNEFETPGVVVDVTVSNHAVRLLSEVIQVRKGEIHELPLEITGFDTLPQIMCASSDERVATVDSENRKVTIVGDGRAEITIEFQDGPTLMCTYFCVERPEGMCTETEWQVFVLTNQNRMNEGHDPLTMFPHMQEATDIRKEELARLFSHTRPDGSSCFTVFDEIGLEISSAGENIAYGYGTPEAVLNGWMNSPGHYRNIMGDYEHFAAGEMNNEWVQMFIGCQAEMDLIAMAPSTGNRTFKKGTSVEDFREIVVLNCKEHGNVFMPLLSPMCTGYDPNKPGEQIITVYYKDKTVVFTVTVEDSGGDGSFGDFEGGNSGEGNGSGEGGSSGGNGGSGGGGSSGGSGGSGGGSGSGGGGSVSRSSFGPGASEPNSPGSAPTLTGAWIRDTIGWWFKLPDGSYPRSQWARINGATYYFNEVGYMAEGWVFLGNKWYYLMPVSGTMAVGWVKDRETWYYLNMDGSMATGWIQVSGKWYYLRSDGAMLANTITPDNFVVGADGAWIP